MKRLAVLLALLAATARAEPRLAAFFGDHMVLQRDRPLRVWGSGSPGERLQVAIAGHRASTMVPRNGRWQLTLPALPAGGPHELVLRAGATTTRLQDVLVGELWLAGGQSNMEWNLARAEGGDREAAEVDDPQIRVLRVPHVAALRPKADVAAAPWVPATRGAAGDFSAVGWFFARKLRAALGVPVGLVDVSWGGAHLETWTRREAALADPALARFVRMLPADTPAFLHRRARQLREQALRWQGGLPMAAPGFAGWAAAGEPDARWREIQVPGAWEEQGLADFDGRVWFRRHVRLTAAQADGAATLHLGSIDDCDESFVNGRPVGGLCQWDAPRHHALPAGVLHEGDNVIAVRVTDTGGGGGFHGDAAALQLALADGTRLPLAGRWRARVEAAAEPKELRANDAPTLAFNGMVAPLAGLPLAGAVWYQGESNVGRAAAYAGAFRRHIADWRRHFGRADLPFLFVQLAAFLPLERNTLQGSAWAELRDAQRQALALPHTGMVVATDVGDASDIHPRRKRPVGERLAALALGEAAGPLYRSMRVAGTEARLRFDGGPLQARREGEGLRGFAVAGADRRFVEAEARLEGDEVVVSSPAVARPVAVRFGWVDNPEQTNLVDRRGWPVSPFRTDRWPLLTRHAQYP